MIKWGNERHINVCALFLNNSRLTERCSVVPLIEPAGVTPGYCDPQEGEVSSLLKGGSSHTELALAMRQSSLVVKWMEGVVRGYKPDAHTIVTTAERKHPCPFS